MKHTFIILIVILDLLFVLFASVLTSKSMLMIMFHEYHGYGHYIPIELIIWLGAMVVVSVLYIVVASVSSSLYCKGKVDSHVSNIMLVGFYVVHLLIFLVCVTLEEKYFYYMRIDEYGLLKMLFFITVPAINYLLLKLLVEKPALDYRKDNHSSFGK